MRWGTTVFTEAKEFEFGKFKRKLTNFSFSYMKFKFRANAFM